MQNIPAVAFLQEKNKFYHKNKINKTFLTKNLIGKLEAFSESGYLIGPLLGGGLFATGGPFAVFMPFCFIYFILEITFIFLSRTSDQGLKPIEENLSPLPTQSPSKKVEKFTNLTELLQKGQYQAQTVFRDSSFAVLGPFSPNISSAILESFDESSTDDLPEIDMFNIFFNRKVFLNGVIIFLPLFAQSFVDSTLSLFLGEQFGFSEIQAGIFVSTNTSAFILVTSFFHGFYTKTEQTCRITIIISLFFCSMSFFFYGPDSTLNIHSHIAISAICSIIIGTCKGNIVVSESKLLDYVISVEYPQYTKEQQIFIISILYNMFQDFGWVCGPIVGGLMTEYLSFARSASIFGMIIFFYTIYYIITFRLPSRNTIIPQVQTLNSEVNIEVKSIEKVKQNIIPSVQDIEYIKNKLKLQPCDSPPNKPQNLLAKLIQQKRTQNYYRNAINPLVFIELQNSQNHSNNNKNQIVRSKTQK